jgi:hypothetical protein
MDKVFELKLALKKLDVATYFRKISGITFQRMLVFQVREDIATDRLIVSEEAVRVLDLRE